ncbi:hypothetical protein BpOF4_04475 [Alkalihalophilus pseudofirmus OF4]|uniref:Uncharacterized protein n=1 Tax=Alkalihalophilus pseudofirmus (strain ATCC BAA-2126 / JCM 17055 / OF4) TaxID=398511 RepID=D3FYS6_ALKPO|nr:hypothetical protein [Alkalihalophilus pseudofirmus]ADC48959.1 hypothetical protein BpOF4_04475 [Alkalihalophilus pseudofirmus OF4]
MDCLYYAHEHYGPYGEQRKYLEREGGRPLFPDNVAIIEFDAKPFNDGFLCEYQVKTIVGETLGFERFFNETKIEAEARLLALEKAVIVANTYKSHVMTLVGGKLSSDIATVLKIKITIAKENAE